MEFRPRSKNCRALKRCSILIWCLPIWLGFFSAKPPIAEPVQLLLRAGAKTNNQIKNRPDLKIAALLNAAQFWYGAYLYGSDFFLRSYPSLSPSKKKDLYKIIITTWSIQNLIMKMLTIRKLLKKPNFFRFYVEDVFRSLSRRIYQIFVQLLKKSGGYLKK